MALGASHGEVWRLVLSETLRIAGTGIVCGVSAARAAMRLIAGFLYGIQPSDPSVLLASALLLALIAMIAGYVPAPGLRASTPGVRYGRSRDQPQANGLM